MPGKKQPDFEYARNHPGMFVLFLVLGANTIWFVATRSHYFTDFSEASFNPYYWPRRWALLPHVAGGATAMAVGLVQLWLGCTRRTGRLHKVLGRVYVIAITIGVPAALYLAVTAHGLVYRLGLLCFDIAWASTTAMGVISIRRRNIAHHRAWMTRSYIVTFGFATFRILYWCLASRMAHWFADGASDLESALAWLCWSVPLIFFEIMGKSRLLRPAGCRDSPVRQQA